MTTGREELLPISIFACAEAMESIERFPLNPIEMEAGTDREIEGKSAPMVWYCVFRYYPYRRMQFPMEK